MYGCNATDGIGRITKINALSFINRAAFKCGGDFTVELSSVIEILRACVCPDYHSTQQEHKPSFLLSNHNVTNDNVIT